MKLVILSDTHGLLRPQVLHLLRNADAILHAGDINRQAVADTLGQYAPLYLVRGNNDKDWAAAIPLSLQVTLGGVTFYMVHNKQDIPADLSGVDVVVYGHSHKYAQTDKDGVLWLNPGSCGPRRFHQEITLATMEVEAGTYTVEKIVIPHEEQEGSH
jgi:putative phosphoesterase